MLLRILAWRLCDYAIMPFLLSVSLLHAGDVHALALISYC